MEYRGIPATYNKPIGPESETLVGRVAEILTRYNMLSRGSRIGVAVSGGADSVALLHVLHRLAPDFSADLLILHVNHGLRGVESDADETFVRELAGSLGHPIAVEHAPPIEGNIEQAARDARRDFFRRAIQTERLEHVALGHTRSDQAETVLLRLFRGSGLAGLAGMRFVTEAGFVRPLLAVTRAEVRAWAAAQGIGWREDSSNADLRFSRNRLRSKVLPHLAEHFNPNLEEILSLTASLAAAEEDYWAGQIEPLFAQICRPSRFGLILDIPLLAGLHPAVRRRVLRRALWNVRGDLRSIDIRHIDAILQVCSSGRAHDRVIVPGVDALRSYGKLRLAPPSPNPVERDYALDLLPGQEQELPGGAGRIYLHPLEPYAPFCANFKEDKEDLKLFSEVAELDADALPDQSVGGRISIRNWTPGDAVLLPGHRTPEKIKSLFQEHRVLLWERRHWPVALSGGEIVWVKRFGVAAKFRISERTRRHLHLFYRASE